MRYTDEQLIELIRREGVVTTNKLASLTGYERGYLRNVRLKSLIDKGAIRRFQLVIGSGRGSIRGRATDLFNGLAACPGRARYYYYVDEDAALNFLMRELSLSKNLPHRRKSQLTRYLRRNLPKSLFERLRNVYLRRAPVVQSGQA